MLPAGDSHGKSQARGGVSTRPALLCPLVILITLALPALSYLLLRPLGSSKGCGQAEGLQNDQRDPETSRGIPKRVEGPQNEPLPTAEW